MSKPNVLLFTCDWSKNPDTFKPESSGVELKHVGVKCTGRIDPVHIFESLNGECDGVLLMACPEGDCHFREGNIQAGKKVKMTRKLMELAGLEPERLSINWASPLDPASPSIALNEFLDAFKELGVKQLKDSERLKAAQLTLANYRMRAFVGNEHQVTEKGNVYGELIPMEKFDGITEEALTDEFYRNWIHMLLGTEVLSVKQLAKRVHLDPAVVLGHVVALVMRQKIQQDSVDGMSPLYVAMEAS